MPERRTGEDFESQTLYDSNVETPGIENEESRSQSEIRDALANALENALPYEYYRALKDADDILVNRYHQGAISVDELRASREQYRAPVTGSVDLWSLQEFALALECLNYSTEEARRETLGHEYSHYLAATTLGLLAWFNIRFLRGTDGRVARIYSVQLDLPKDLDEVTRKEAIRRIASAPTNLSESDRRILGI